MNNKEYQGNSISATDLEIFQTNSPKMIKNSFFKLATYGLTIFLTLCYWKNFVPN